MRLKEYIEKVGDDRAAEVLEVKPRTVASWRRGERLPRPKLAREIVERTGGAVTLAEIYQQQQ